MIRIIAESDRRRRACIPVAIALAILCLASSARAQNKILYTTQTNPPPPGVTAGANSYDPGQTWASEVCATSDVTQGFPFGAKIEWAPVLDPGQDAETTLAAVSGTVAYNPQPDESGYCQGGTCPGQPIPCSGPSFDCFSACGGFCDLSQGPSCVGGACPSPWTDPQVGFPLSCVNDAPCAACGGTCGALGRSRGDLQMTHPFGFDYDVAIAPDQSYLSLLSPGNLESIHVDPSDSTGQTAKSGFEDVVYPYLHATTPVNGTNKGWCTPDFSTRCSSSMPCPSGETCEGSINGLGLDPSTLPGTLGMETDHDLIPDNYQPHDGDRIAVFGRWIVDCGHGDKSGTPGWHTEIHPPLLVATARSTGSGDFGANCSAEQTCSSMIGRPFLISQQFGDGAFARHLEDEVEKLGCLEVTGPTVSAGIAAEGPFAGLPDCNLGLDGHCVCNGDLGCEACEIASCATLDACFAGIPFTCGASPPPFGAPCTTQLEERPQIDRVPFAGTQDMQYYIQPASGRLHPGDRMLAEWQMTARNGVNVALSNGGDAGVLVDVTLDHSNYHAATLPNRQDWVVDPGEIYPGFSLAGIGKFFVFIVAPIQTAIVNQGLFTDRYDAPQVPITGTPTSTFADQLDGTMQAADIDDSQPFPVSGRINVGWSRCSPGGPYVAECTGPTTTVNLNGAGSNDPDGNTISFDWSGGFVGGSATGEMPSVQFPGTGTFPVNLTVADNQTSTSCSTSATVRDTTPPTIAISQPAQTTYPHSATLTLNYAVTDVCTGVSSFTPTMDGLATLAGHGLQSGQAIDLSELAIGRHVFAIEATDNAGNTDRVSVTFTVLGVSRIAGSHLSDGPSGGVAVSSDENFVAFYSDATNLVAHDTNGLRDVFVADRGARTFERVSVSTSGAQANGPSQENGGSPALNANGMTVAFYSAATNLVDHDTNSVADVFVRDRTTGTTERVSVSTTGTQANGPSFFPTISADGRFVAFESLASNLVDNDTNGFADIFIRDRTNGTTERACGVQGDNASFSPSISADGMVVAFASAATNFVPGDTNGRIDIFVCNRSTGTTERVSIAGDGTQANGSSRSPAIDEDGSVVAFTSDASNLVAGDRNGLVDVLARDRLLGTTERISVSRTGGDADDASFAPAINSDGRYVAFASYATNLVAHDLNYTPDIFVRDRQTGVTRIADVRPDGEHGNRGTSSARPAISGDGVLVAFLSLSSNLAGRDSETTDVFLTTSPFLAPPTTGALATQDAVAPSTEALAHADCVGVCGAERVVGAADLITGVNIALGGLPLDVCSSFDADGDGMVTVGELIGGVHNALNGCP